MTRTKSTSMIEAKITKLETGLDKAQKTVDTITEKLLKAQKRKQECETRQIMETYRKSGKSLQELMTFMISEADQVCIK